MVVYLLRCNDIDNHMFIMHMSLFQSFLHVFRIECYFEVYVFILCDWVAFIKWVTLLYKFTWFYMLYYHSDVHSQSMQLSFVVWYEILLPYNSTLMPGKLIQS